MANPQQPELSRSRRTPLDPDSIGSEIEARSAPVEDDAAGPVPPENQPGHRPERDQDKPDPEQFLARAREGAPPQDRQD
ncbi:MAG: hypothetical protein M3N25_05150 [Actinomycetota bacterium]|nr:hypothetical protein [Actinomycetota bacterium]